MIKVDPGAIVFTRGFSLERTHAVDEKIIVEKLIEERIIITISKAMIMNIGITSVTK